MYLINQLHSENFGNLGRVENVVDCLFVIDQCQFLLRICILIGLMFHLLRDRIYFFNCRICFFNVFWFFNCSFLCK